MAKKKGVDVMIALLGKKPKGEDAEDGGGSPKEEAAQRLIDGVKAGSAKKVALAFEELYAICAESDYEDDEEMDEEEDEDSESDYA